MAARNDLHISTVAIPWQLTHMLHSKNYSQTRPLKLNSFFSFLYRPDFCYPLPLFFLFFLHELFHYQLRIINTISTRKQYRSRKTNRSRKRSTAVMVNKAVIAFLLGKLAQLFYLAHSFVFFLGEIQLSEQQQNSDHRSQYVYGN